MADHIEASEILSILNELSQKVDPEETLDGFVAAVNRGNLPVTLSRTPGSGNREERPVPLKGLKDRSFTLYQAGSREDLSPKDIEELRKMYELLEGILERQLLRREQELLERQIEESARYVTLGQLSRGVAHDFNNYLAGILGYTDLALRKAEEGSPGRQMLELIHENSLKTADFVKQLLQISRKQGSSVEILNIKEIIEEVLPLLQHLVKSDVEIATSFEEGLWSLEGDGSQIEQLIINLFLNARDALPRGGKITLSADKYTVSSGTLPGGTPCRSGGYVRVTVADTGMGIEPENMARIFDAFFTTKDPGRGPGLGLTRARAVMREHSGWIEGESEPSRGSRFHLYFPGVGQMGAEAPEKTSITTAPPRPLALIVEDEPIVLEMVTFLMETSGFEIISCDDPQKGVEIFRKNQEKISLVISDMVMPNLTGDEFLRRLRGFDPDIRMILMSGYGDDTIQARLDEKTRFIQKPFNVEAFSKIVKEVTAPG